MKDFKDFDIAKEILNQADILDKINLMGMMASAIRNTLIMIEEVAASIEKGDVQRDPETFDLYISLLQCYGEIMPLADEIGGKVFSHIPEKASFEMLVAQLRNGEISEEEVHKLSMEILHRFKTDTFLFN